MKTHVKRHDRNVNLKMAQLQLAKEKKLLQREESTTFNTFNPERVIQLEKEIKKVKKEIRLIQANPNLTRAQADKLLHAKKQQHERHIKNMKKELHKIIHSKHKIGTAAHDIKKGLGHFIHKEEEHAKHWWKTKGKEETKHAIKKTEKWLAHEAHTTGHWAAKKVKEGYHAFGSWISKKWAEHKAQKAIKKEVGQKLETYTPTTTPEPTKEEAPIKLETY